MEDSMKTKNETIEFWKCHAANAKLHPISIIAYCKENNLRFSTYYRWSKKVQNLNTDTKLTKPQIKPKKAPSVFLPVEVASKEIKFENHFIKSSLPDAKWVAEVILYLTRGLS